MAGGRSASSARRSRIPRSAPSTTNLSVVPCLARRRRPAGQRILLAGFPVEHLSFPVGDTRLLLSERAGFDAKVKALLGRKLPDRFYSEGDPELPLDFSTRRVAVADHGQLSRHQGGFFRPGARPAAAPSRGARHDDPHPRVGGAGAAEGPRDAGSSLPPTIPMSATRRIVGAAPRHPGRLRVAQFHRVNHAKLLAAIAHEPASLRRRSSAGATSTTASCSTNPLDLSAYPVAPAVWRKRGMTLNYYSNWRDIDLALHDDAAARLLAAHLSTLWFGRRPDARGASLLHRRRGTAAPRTRATPATSSPCPIPTGARSRPTMSRCSMPRRRASTSSTPTSTSRRAAARARQGARARRRRHDRRSHRLRGDLGGDLMTAINEDVRDPLFRPHRTSTTTDPKRAAPRQDPVDRQQPDGGRPGQPQQPELHPRHGERPHGPGSRLCKPRRPGDRDVSAWIGPCHRGARPVAWTTAAADQDRARGAVNARRSPVVRRVIYLPQAGWTRRRLDPGDPAHKRNAHPGGNSSSCSRRS